MKRYRAVSLFFTRKKTVGLEGTPVPRRPAVTRMMSLCPSGFAGTVLPGPANRLQLVVFSQVI